MKKILIKRKSATFACNIILFGGYRMTFIVYYTASPSNKVLQSWQIAIYFKPHDTMTFARVPICDYQLVSLLG